MELMPFFARNMKDISSLSRNLDSAFHWFSIWQNCPKIQIDSQRKPRCWSVTASLLFSTSISIFKLGWRREKVWINPEPWFIIVHMKLCESLSSCLYMNSSFLDTSTPQPTEWQRFSVPYLEMEMILFSESCSFKSSPKQGKWAKQLPKSSTATENPQQSCLAAMLLLETTWVMWLSYSSLVTQNLKTETQQSISSTSSVIIFITILSVQK